MSITYIRTSLVVETDRWLKCQDGFVLYMNIKSRLFAIEFKTKPFGYCVAILVDQKTRITAVSNRLGFC
jgi:hypothetical protein